MRVARSTSARQARNNWRKEWREIYAGGCGLYFGRPHARAEARPGQRYYRSCCQECRYDGRAGDGVPRRDAEDIKSQRRRAVQRDAGAPIGLHSISPWKAKAVALHHAAVEPITAVKLAVSAAHNSLAAMR